MKARIHERERERERGGGSRKSLHNLSPRGIKEYEKEKIGTN